MQEVDGCSGILASLSVENLRFRPKNNEAIEKGRSLALSFEQLDRAERDRLIGGLSAPLGGKLLALSGFMAEAAINSNDGSLLHSAVVLHVIEDFRKDYRENIRYLVLLFNASKVLGIDFAAVARNVASMASERGRKCLLDFASRDEALNRLGSFAIKAEVVDGVFRFVPG